MLLANSNMPCKITRTLFQTRELILRLHVSTFNETYGGFHSEYTFGRNTYTRIEPGVYLTLDIKKPEGQFDRTSSVIIARGNLHIYKKAFKRMLNNIYEQNIFANKGNSVVIYQDMAEKYSERVMIPRLNSGMIMKAAVVFDENDVSYEGVNIYLNKTENMTSLFIDEFEELTNIILDIDLFVYSQLLLNYFVSYYKLNPDNQLPQLQQKTYSNSKGRPVIDWSNSNEPQTESNFRKPLEDDIFSGIEKLE